MKRRFCELNNISFDENVYSCYLNVRLAEKLRKFDRHVKTLMNSLFESCEVFFALCSEHKFIFDLKNPINRS